MTNFTREPGDGQCHLCLRDLFVHGKYNSQHCEACELLLRRHPGRDLSTMRNGRTERLLQEQPVAHWGWRRDADCAGAPGELFWQEVPPGANIPEEIQLAAEVFCADCPVREWCAAEADEHEYVGLWGGAWRWYGGQSSRRRGFYRVRDMLAREPERVA